MITLSSIRRISKSAAYAKGNQLYKSGKIVRYHYTDDHERTQVDADVTGSYGNQYQVNLIYNHENEVFERYQCECEAFYSYSGMCKHCIAVALESHYMEKRQGRSNASSSPEKITSYAKATDAALTNIIYTSSMKEKAQYLQPGLTGQVELIPLFDKQDNRWTVEFKIGASHKYILKNIPYMVEAMAQHEWVEYGKKLAFYHEQSVFTPQSQKLFALLKQYVLHEKEVLHSYYSHYKYSYYNYVETLTKRKLLLSGEWMVQFAQVLAGEAYAVSGIESSQLAFLEQNPQIPVTVEEKNGSYQLSVPAAEVFSGSSRLCIGMAGVIYLCSPDFSQQIRSIGELFLGKKKTYFIHPNDVHAFCSSVLPVLKQCTSCQIPEEFAQYEPQPCQIQVYLDRQNGEITAAPLCFYGENSYNPIEELTVSQMHRDFQKERTLIDTLGHFFSSVDQIQNLYRLSEEDEELVYLLLSQGISTLQQLGEVMISDRLKRIQILPAPKFKIGITMKTGLLDVYLETGQLPASELEAILQSYRRKRKFYRLADGAFLRLEDNALAAVAEMAEGLELTGKQLAQGHLTVPGYRSFYFDQILRENEGELQVKRDQNFKALLREMKNVENSDFQVPDGLNTQLRPYQKFGFRWMMTLKQLGFCGILADDMGLGKTVQAITYLLAQKKAAGNPSPYLGLIVCPASLVYNWESEIRRFAPELETVTVTGSAACRREKIHGGMGDVLITSYDLLKRDLEAYETISFQNVIIDEAQNIKNYTTQAAKSVKALKCAQRFALTGTPIENSLSELWSIFDFLMPGILNSNKRFRDNYEQPITSNQDERASTRLKKMIRPYILRRVKSQVLKELPDKIEKVVYSQMGGEQRKLYDANLQQLLTSLSQQSQEEFCTGKLQILAELTKLRQLCCDPAMVYENYAGEAAKVDTCIELIKSAVAGKNQLLLFSQFTTALDIIAARLSREGIPYYMLTGSTSKEKRAQMATDFNQDKTPVFLISLKAGGTGLNLTAASIVIHFDPWWNMAAQNQATDRAHRIGQKQVVTVYKLLMKNTLEEKIQKLQEQKAQLSDEIISEGSLKDTLATKEELLEILKG